jgi:TetR/AcrR family transcriptional regulator
MDLVKQTTKPTSPVRKPSRSGSRGRPEESRQAILKAALTEFSAQGIAGARTDSIAEAAGVNKALLYYYFEDKEGLYRATLEKVFSGLFERERVVLAGHGAALDKLVKYAVTHFDYIAENPSYSRLMQGEMMRAGVGKSPHIQYLADKYFRKFFEALMAILEEGMRRGELRRVDPMNTILSIVGLTVFYFVSTPVARAIGRQEPFSSEALRNRRAALVDHVTAILKPDNSQSARGKTL